jgi:hypothetical protein
LVDGQSSLLAGVSERRRKALGRKDVKPSRHWVISFVVGILLALLIAAGLFILWVSQP